ncbi:hypothetical protein Pan110_54660 [Gimesia panareensis]|nr:hypothetical protein Pan110_54660 [Gimesia panareensis]
MSTGVKICIYPRSEDFSAEPAFLNLTQKLEQAQVLKQGWRGFFIFQKEPKLTKKSTITTETEYLIENGQSHAERTGNSRACLIQNNLTDSTCLHYRVYNLLNHWNLSDEKQSLENDPVLLEINTYDRGHYYGHLFRSEGHANFYFEANSGYFVRYDRDFNLDPEYEDYNLCVEENLNIIRELLACIVDALDPLSVKVFTGSGSYAPFNSHATYFANPKAFITDLQMIYDYWIGNFSPYYQGEPKPYQDSDPVAAWYQFNGMRSAEQRKELWEDFNAWLIMREEVTSEVVYDTWDVKQSVEDGGLDIRRTKQGGAFVFGSEHFFNSFVSDVYLHALNIAYLVNKDKIELKIQELEAQNWQDELDRLDDGKFES